jgi:hypothetical protein
MLTAAVSAAAKPVPMHDASSIGYYGGAVKEVFQREGATGEGDNALPASQLRRLAPKNAGQRIVKMPIGVFAFIGALSIGLLRHLVRLYLQGRRRD